MKDQLEKELKELAFSFKSGKSGMTISEIAVTLIAFTILAFGIFFASKGLYIY